MNHDSCKVSYGGTRTVVSRASFFVYRMYDVRTSLIVHVSCDGQKFPITEVVPVLWSDNLLMTFYDPSTLNSWCSKHTESSIHTTVNSLPSSQSRTPYHNSPQDLRHLTSPCKWSYLKSHQSPRTLRSSTVNLLLLLYKCPTTLRLPWSSWYVSISPGTNLCRNFWCF